MAAVSDDFYRKVLAGIGAPQSTVNVNIMHAWQKAEGGNAANNPFNTNRSAPGATRYNSVGVKNYPDEATGVAATVGALNLAYYVGIRAAFKIQQPGAVAAAIITSPWGTKSIPGIVNGAVTGAADTARDVVGAATSPVKGVVELAARTNNILERLTKKETWIRTGLFILGSVLAIYGLFLLMRKPILSAAGKVTSAVATRKVA